MAKTPQLHPKQSIYVSYPKLTFKPMFGSRRATISSWALLYICSFSSYSSLPLHLDDYNLTYSQNINMVFEKKLTVTPLKPHHFLYTKISQNQSKQIKTIKHNLEQPPKLVYNQCKHFHPKILGFSSTQHKKRKVRVWFPYR